jgi:hypothetical protein
MHRLVGSAAALALLGVVPASPAASATNSGAFALPARLAAPHAATGATASASSPNWVGYAVNTSVRAGSYTSVQASWTQPAVDCSHGDGTVVFWVGLDGWGDTAVEQDGTQAKCAGGVAGYSAWWEIYPTNSITAYPDTIAPGDQLTAKVIFSALTGYELYLSDATQGWTEDASHTGAAGAANSSAEIVAETPGSGSTLADLPDFGSVAFTGGQINGAPVADSGALGINLVRNNNTLATTSDLTGGTDFTIEWKQNS